jgi:hypothetical protein
MVLEAKRSGKAGSWGEPSLFGMTSASKEAITVSSENVALILTEVVVERLLLLGMGKWLPTVILQLMPPK